MQGVLLVDKPKTWTSFDVVNFVRKIVAAEAGKKPKNTKVGHTGTLDPLATGLLVLVVGKDYTRRAGEFSKLDKTYEVVMKLGETSTTADEEGEKTPVSNREPLLEEMQQTLRQFQGDSMQTPPAFSAMKINGQRAYKLARQGKVVELEPRPVRINSTELVHYAYPYVTFTADVSSGTYIRSLVEDIGKQLKTGAYMSDLRRTKVGNFMLEDAITLDTIDIEILSNNLRQI
jgi:tRNA pseudouridine55 synthase